MSGWILLIIALIAAGFHLLDRFLITVRLHEVEKVGQTLALRKLSALIAGPCCGESRLLNINLCEYGNNFMACAGSSYIVFALGLH